MLGGECAGEVGGEDGGVDVEDVLGGLVGDGNWLVGLADDGARIRLTSSHGKTSTRSAEEGN